METREQNSTAAETLKRPGASLLKLRAKLLPAILSYGVAGACLYWVFNDLDFGELLQSFIGVNWWWVLPAIAFDLLVYVVAGWEWRILLQPAGRLSLSQTTQAIFAGRFANDVLPVHVGYVIRIYLVSRWTNANVAAVAPSLLVERLFDGFWLALGIGMAAVFLPLPGEITTLAEIWIAIIVFGLIAGIIIVFRKPGSGGHNNCQNSWWKWTEKFREAFDSALEQLRAIGRSWLAAAGLGLSLLKLAAQFLAFVCLFRAYHLRLPLPAQLAVFLMAYAGLSMPSTPASLGMFQLFCIAGLAMFDVPKGVAAGFALLAFTTLTIPLSFAGFFAFAQSGLTLRQIRNEGRVGI